jgi:hypothetical protein
VAAVGFVRGAMRQVSWNRPDAPRRGFHVVGAEGGRQ